MKKKIFDFKQTIIDALNECDIKELRTFGKRAGISAPTRLNKASLVQEIAYALYGDADEFFMSEQNAIEVGNLDRCKKHAKMDTTKLSSSTLSTSYENYSINTDRIHVKTFCGYYEKYDDSYGVVKNNDGSIVIPVIKSHYNDFDFKNYDNITVTHKETSRGYVRNSAQITAVNGRSLDAPVQDCEYQNLTAVPCLNTISIETPSYFMQELKQHIKVAYGGRIVVCGENGSNRRQVMKSLIDDFATVKDALVFPIIMDYPRELIDYYKQGYPQAIVTSPFDAYSASVDKILLSINRAIRMVESGGNAIVIIDNLNSLLDLFSNLADVDEYSAALKNVIKLFNLGAMFNNGASLTMCAFVDYSDQRLVNKLANTSMFVVEMNDEHQSAEHDKCIIKNVRKDYQKFCTEEGSESVIKDVLSSNSDFKIREKKADDLFRSFGRFKF